VLVRHTKIIATLGPASRDIATIEALIVAGVDVFRLNFSHGDTHVHEVTMTRVREAAKRAGRHVAILQDLSGPKIRTGALEGRTPLKLNPGDRFEIAIGSFPGKPGIVSTTYAPLARALKPNDQLLLDDGRIELRVESVSGDRIVTRVIDGGELGEHKGINAPNVPLPAAGLTEKDESDLRFGLAAGVDLVAMSFVQSAKDVVRARLVTADMGRFRVPIVAKVERPEALRCLHEIAAASDALMVARGDLGLELPLEEVPRVQKEVLRVGRERGVPVIVATQVLESMVNEPRPTRAEVSDAAGAVDAGADAIMLSGETAVGAHPVRTVEVLASIIRHAEAVPPIWSLPSPTVERPDHLPSLCDAAVTLAARGGADVIVAITREGRTARVLAARRPQVPIYAATNKDEVARRLCLWWGVNPVIDQLDGDADLVTRRVLETLRSRGGVLPTPARVAIVSANPNIEQTGVNFVAIRQS
jgi:pyruvate kinase